MRKKWSQDSTASHNWQALKTGLSTTSRKVKSSPSKATIVGAEPQLFVTDVKRSCEFFREKLGFSLVFSYGKPPYYAQVGRDAARLNLRYVDRPVIESSGSRSGGTVVGIYDRRYSGRDQAAVS